MRHECRLNKSIPTFKNARPCGLDTRKQYGQMTRFIVDVVFSLPLQTSDQTLLLLPPLNSMYDTDKHTNVSKGYAANSGSFVLDIISNLFDMASKRTWT